jgi:hypothetical protein
MTKTQARLLIGVGVVTVASALALGFRGSSVNRSSIAEAAARTAVTSAAEPSAPPGAAPAPAEPRSEVGEVSKLAPEEAADAAESRRRAIREIVDSGPATGEWTLQAQTTFASLEKAIPRALAGRIVFKKTACYQRACLVDVGYPDMKAFQETNRPLLESSAFANWKGGRGRSAVDVSRNGTVQVTWWLMRPE